MRSTQSSFNATGRHLLGLLCAASAAAALPCKAADKVPIRLIDDLPVVQVTLGAIRADFLLDTGDQLGITVPQPLVIPAAQVSLRDEFQRDTRCGRPHVLGTAPDGQ